MEQASQKKDSLRERKRERERKGKREKKENQKDQKTGVQRAGMPVDQKTSLLEGQMAKTRWLDGQRNRIVDSYKDRGHQVN